MNKREMAQAIIKAKREGLSIVRWIPQTRTGERILGEEYMNFGPIDRIKLPTLVTCPTCRSEVRQNSLTEVQT